MKISDKLLGFVLGCQCEFDKINDNTIYFNCESDDLDEKYCCRPHHKETINFSKSWINLDTFILNAVNYFYNNYSWIISICPNSVTADCLSFISEKWKTIKTIPGNKESVNEKSIEVLEWVANEVNK